MISLSVCLSVTYVSPAKAGELIKMPFGLLSQVGPSSHVLDGQFYGGCLKSKVITTAVV